MFAMKTGRTVLDPQALSRLAALNTLGTNDFVEEMLSSFLARTPEILKQIDLAAENKNSAGIYDLVHNLKSVAASIGALALAEIAEQIECAADEKLPGEFAKLLGKLNDCYAETKIEILKL